MKFLPFKPLMETLKFQEDDARRQYVAMVDGEEFAYANYAAVAHKEAMDAWKTEVRRRILSLSSTVVLRTACGCEQLKDLSDHGQLRAYFVPLMWTRSAMKALREDTANPYDPMERGNVREFRWDHRMYHDNGARVLEEVV